MSPWHSKSLGETLEELETDRSRGLREDEAARRLKRYGPNQLRGKPQRSLVARLLEQLGDPMILVLLAAAFLSLWSSGGEDWLDGCIILLIVAVNALISISQENSAQRALEALQKMSAPQARVVRDGREVRLDAALVVPGDVVHLEAGDLAGVARRMYNVFEDALPLHRRSRVNDIKNILIQCGALGASMSGTGPTAFGLFEDKNCALEAHERLNGLGGEVFLTQTV